MLDLYIWMLRLATKMWIWEQQKHWMKHQRMWPCSGRRFCAHPSVRGKPSSCATSVQQQETAGAFSTTPSPKSSLFAASCPQRWLTGTHPVPRGKHMGEGKQGWQVPPAFPGGMWSRAMGISMQVLSGGVPLQTTGLLRRVRYSVANFIKYLFQWSVTEQLGGSFVNNLFCNSS